jgi:hypothetical protein
VAATSPRTLPRWAWGAAAAVAVTGAAVLFLSGREPEPQQAQPAAPSPDVVSELVAAPAAAARAQPAPAPAPPSEPAAGAAGPERVVSLRPGQVLATIRGVQILASDLGLAFPSDGQPREIASPMLDYLLARAIQREVVLQEARAKGVEVDDPQKRRVEAAVASAEAVDPRVFDGPHGSAQATGQRRRDLTAAALEVELYQRSGAPPASVTAEQVDRYYREHQESLGALPSDPEARKAAWALLELRIRDRLAGPTEAAWQRARQEYLQRLVAAAGVQRAPLP